MIQPGLIPREATPKDLQQLANLIHFETYVHRHLDYRPPLDWLGSHPFLVLEENHEVRAALACPPDPPGIVWIRLFAVSSKHNTEPAWRILWGAAYHQLRLKYQPNMIAAIPLNTWFEVLLKKSNFHQTHQIVTLGAELGSRGRGMEPQTGHQEPIVIRAMTREDLSRVFQVDKAAFEPLWQNSLTYLEVAFQQAIYASVAEKENQLVGYQISTPTPLGGHLARLAVLPEFQGQGVGFAIVHDLLSCLAQRGAHMVTVNTQKDNIASLALYKKAGFSYTGEEFPIYQYDSP